jgi:murein DD-endopeptidase MepM/ murein hydrolase activator NlpD
VSDPSDPGQPGRSRAERRSGARHEQHRPTSRRAHRSKRRWLPTPAVLGATALVVAGIGAVLASSGAAGSSTVTAQNPLRTLSVNINSDDTATGTPSHADSTHATIDARRYAESGDVGAPPRAGSGETLQQVSRGVDRATLQQQAELQATQRMQALADLANRVQARAEELRSDQWVLPVTGYQITATFGETSYLWSTVHTGLDFATAEGTPIVSVAQGTVTSTAYDGAYGNKTVVTLDDGTEIWYCHQSSQAVSVGDVVAPGETIGAVGATGNTTGAHLHLEVRPHGGDPVDPFTALVAHGVHP